MLNKVCILVLLLATTACAGGENPTSPSLTRVITLSGDLIFSVIAGTTTTATLLLSNTGSDALSITGITAPAGFSASWTGGSIAPGASQLSTVTFSPPAPGTYAGTITVSGNLTGGTNTISVSGSAYPDLRGVWAGRHTFIFVGSSGSRDESWVVTEQSGPLFSGTWRLAAVGPNPLQSGTTSGSVSVTGDITQSYVTLVEPSSCERLEGDGFYKGSLSGATATLQYADKIKCPGQAESSRTHLVSMRRQ